MENLIDTSSSNVSAIDGVAKRALDIRQKRKIKKI